MVDRAIGGSASSAFMSAGFPISMRTDIPMDEVEEVLDEEDMIIEEELCKCRKKKCMITTILVVVFVLGAAVAVYV